MGFPSDEELLRRACQGTPVKREYSGVYRWSFVRDRFLLGSTYAQQLCIRLGLNPDERVRKS